MKKRIVFWGDSITDSLRDKEQTVDITGYSRMTGSGYVRLIEASLGYDYPMRYEILNRGVSGDRIVDLYARIKKDVINLKPDIVSILVGINDVGHELAAQNGVDAEKFEMVYDWIVRELLQALPGVKIMILEPFVLHGICTENKENCLNRWELFLSETRLRQIAAKRIADKHGLTFVPLQNAFDQAIASTKEEGYWLGDGVHPRAGGHELIKRKWLEAFRNI